MTNVQKDVTIKVEEDDRLTLVILAAGMGSRFGGLKQVEPVGPNGEFIIDYSIYDAIKSGFDKLVFIISKDNYKLFKKTIGRRIEKYIETKYVFQDSIREKPLGTAHAVLCCKDDVNEPFMMINADDFYGRDSFKKASYFLKNKVKNNNYGMVSYKIKNTLTENGRVNRGICVVDSGYLTKVVESEVEKINGKIIAKPLDKNEEEFVVNEDTEASMNMLMFDKSIFELLEKEFKKFIIGNNLADSEFMIPDVLLLAIKERYASCEVILTDSKWYGITYKDDLKKVKDAIKKMIDSNIYPNKLWK